MRGSRPPRRGRQLRLFDLPRSDGDSATTVTRPARRSRVQTRKPPGTASSALATPSGIVVRTESDDSTVRWIEDRNVPGNDSPLTLTSGSLRNFGLWTGQSVADKVKYAPAYWQCVANYGSTMTSGSRVRWDRAVQMAAADPSGIELIGDGIWLVRSESGHGSYKVRIAGEQIDWSCDCADFKDWREACKHIYRVYQHLFPGRPFLSPSHEEPVGKKTYSQNWPAYDLAQQEEYRLIPVLLRDLVDTVQDRAPRPKGPGRPPLRIQDRAFCAIDKVYSGLSCHRSKGLYIDAANKGHLGKAPGYVVSSRFFNDPESTPILEELLTRSALPVLSLETCFAPDSTGVQTTSFGAWREARHGERREHVWLKAHALVGLSTHVIVRMIVTDKDGSDYKQFEQLLRGAAERGVVINEVCADKAYSGRSNYLLAEKMGFDLWAPFKSNDSPRPTTKRADEWGNRASSRRWTQAFHFFQLHRPEFEPKYHRRSNIEATFSALKRKFGESVRSKSRVAQVNEILAKAIGYNLTVLVGEIYEHGIVPEFLRDADQLRAGQ